MAVTVAKKGVFTGTSGDDNIRVKGDSVVVNANSGNDTVTLKRGNRNIIFADSGDDSITFSVAVGSRNRVEGGYGDDTVILNGGNKDRIYGNDGNDTFILNRTIGAGNYVYGGRGADTFVINGKKKKNPEKAPEFEAVIIEQEGRVPYTEYHPVNNAENGGNV